VPWYLAFSAAVLILWGFSSPRDRNALRIVLLATVGSLLLTEGLTRQIAGSWKLVVPATVEALTILALLRFSKNQTGYIQAGLLGIAWASHILCFYDLKAGTKLVYDQYETILGWVAAGQIAAFHDTIFRMGSRIFALVESIRRGGLRGLFASGMPDSVLLRPRNPGLPPSQ